MKDSPKWQSINLLRQVPSDYWLMMVLVFLMKAGQFMLLPYLAIYLTHVTHASTDVVGLVVGSGPLVYGLVGPFCGYTVDRFGRRFVVIVSVFFSGVLFLIFNAHNSVMYFLCMNILVGITRAGFDTASRSYRLHTMTAELRRFCFSLRFAVLNAGAGTGPVIGMLFIEKHGNLLFALNGLIFIILAVVIVFCMRGINDFVEELKPPSIAAVFKVMAQDVRLRVIVVAATFMWICYSQLDSIFGIYLTHKFSNGLQILTWSFVVNTVCCVFFQMPMAKLMSQYTEVKQIYLGTLFYIIGFLIIPFAQHMSGIMFASFLIVFGEIIIGPLTDYMIYKMAPANMIGSYYGALALSMGGVGLGPIVGGYFYEYLNATALFMFCVLLFVVMGILFLSIQNKIFIRK